MISYLTGILIAKSPVQAVLETSMGMAFDLHIPISTFEQLPDIGNTCKLFTNLHTTQDEIRLFGFYTSAECELFKQLTRVPGVGPKSALSIISTLTIPSLIRAVEKDEPMILTKVPGIGAKSAQRLIIELRGKLHFLAELTAPNQQDLGDTQADEIEAALQSLGFNPREVRKEIALIRDESLSLNSEQLIKEIIRRLYQRNK